MSLTYALPSSTASIPNTHPVKPQMRQLQIVKHPFSYPNFHFTPFYYGLLKTLIRSLANFFFEENSHNSYWLFYFSFLLPTIGLCFNYH